MNRQDDEIDDGSPSSTMDEGRRGVAVDDVIGEEAPAGWRTEEGVGLRGFSLPPPPATTSPILNPKLDSGVPLRRAPLPTAAGSSFTPAASE